MNNTIKTKRYRKRNQRGKLDWAYDVDCPRAGHVISLEQCLKCKHSGGMADMLSIVCKYLSWEKEIR